MLLAAHAGQLMLQHEAQEFWQNLCQELPLVATHWQHYQFPTSYRISTDELFVLFPVELCKEIENARAAIQAL